MNIRILPSSISGAVTIPPSKSLTHRYYMLASLAKSKSIIAKPLVSDDTEYTLDGLRSLGVRIVKNKNSAVIYGSSGVFHPVRKSLFLGDSGTSARFFIGLSTLSVKPITIDGSPRLRERPSEELFRALENQGIGIEYGKNKYHLPVTVSGNRLNGGVIKISGSTSSQFISSLLLIAPFAKRDVTIKIQGELKSKPYIDLTIQAMKQFGVNVINDAYQSFSVKKNQLYKNKSITVEGDFSSASYFIILSLLNRIPIAIGNCNPQSNQGDRSILSMIQTLGALPEFKKRLLFIHAPNEIQSAEFDIADCPDIALSLGIIGPFTQNYLTLRGTNYLKTKESDRARALLENLRRLGGEVKKGNDYLIICRSDLHSAEVDSFGDHRVAMAFSILGTMIPNGIVIKNAEVVSKSYPGFFENLRSLGVTIITS